MDIFNLKLFPRKLLLGYYANSLGNEWIISLSFQDENIIITKIYWIFTSLKCSFIWTYLHNNLIGKYYFPNFKKEETEAQKSGKE